MFFFFCIAQVVIVTGVFCASLFIVLMTYARHKGLVGSWTVPCSLRECLEILFRGSSFSLPPSLPPRSHMHLCWDRDLVKQFSPQTMANSYNLSNPWSKASEAEIVKPHADFLDISFNYFLPMIVNLNFLKLHTVFYLLRCNHSHNFTYLYIFLYDWHEAL